MVLAHWCDMDWDALTIGKDMVLLGLLGMGLGGELGIVGGMDDIIVIMITVFLVMLTMMTMMGNVGMAMTAIDQTG